MSLDDVIKEMRASLDCFLGKSGVTPKQLQERILESIRTGEYAPRHPFFDERDVDVIQRPDGSFFCCLTPGITDWCDAQRAFIETRYD